MIVDRLGNPSARLILVVLIALVALTLAARATSSAGAIQFLLLMAIAGFAFLLLVQRPALALPALAGLSFTIPLAIGTGTEVELTLPVVLTPVFAAAWVLHGLRAHSFQLPHSRTTVPLLLFVASGLLALGVGNATWDPLVPRPGNLIWVQLGQWAVYALSAITFLMAASLGTRGRWLEWATWIFLSVAAMTFTRYVWVDLDKTLGWSYTADRSMFWVWLAALSFGQLLFNRRLARTARLALLALLLVTLYTGVFLNADKISTWVPMGIAALTVALLWLWRKNRAAGLLAALAIIVLVIAFYPVLYEHAGGDREFYMSWGGRQLLWKTTLDLVQGHPLFGLGPAAYRHYGFSRWLTAGPGSALWTHPNISSHNNYIDIYAQMGLVGLALFLWFLVELGLLGARLSNRFRGDFNDGYVQATIGGLVGTLVAMVLADWFLPFVYNIGYNGFRTSILAWMFLGGLVALEQLARDESLPGGGERDSSTEAGTMAGPRPGRGRPRPPSAAVGNG